MRSMQRLSSILLVALVASVACDPGASVPLSTKKANGSGGTTGTTAEPNPLLQLPDEPPGEVSMTPPGAGALDVFEQNRALGRGINFGNTLDAPVEGSWGVALKPYMFQIVKDVGFDSIRLPVRWSNHAATTAPYTIEPAFFRRIDWAIAHALTRGLRIVVDIHHYGNTNEEGMYDQPAKHHDRFLALWQQIAEHYRDYPKELYFEVLNEPRQALEPLWNQYLAEAVEVIRASNPGRTLVVGGIWWNKWDALSKVAFPAGDNNIIATFHYYNPYCFTLQDGQTWEPACKPPNGDVKTAGTPNWPVIYPLVDPNPNTTALAQRKKLEQDMAAAAAWGKAANRPLYMGEFGVSLDSDAKSRVDYIASLARAAEKSGITWGYWELASSMGLWNQSQLTWDVAILEALLPSTISGTAGAAGAPGYAGAAGNVGAGGSAGGAGSDPVPGTAGTGGAYKPAGGAGGAEGFGEAGTTANTAGAGTL